MTDPRTTYEDWYREEWMSDDQWECWQFFADLRGGFHHVDGKPKPCGFGVEVNSRLGSWATFDGAGLTRAVLLAHDRAIRFDISPSGPGMLRFGMHKRQRGGAMHERHPTIEDVLAEWRRRNG